MSHSAISEAGKPRSLLAGVADTPLVSVLICTFNRAGLLRRTLESLAVQGGLGLPFEVVVVDDGSEDETREVVESFCGRLSIQYAFQAQAGIGSARNHALSLARGCLVLLHDDDDLAGVRLLSEHANMHHRHPEPWTAVLGFTELAPEIRDDPLMHYVTEVECHLFAYPCLEHGANLDYRHFWGGRISCKRSFILDRGGFNPAFRFGYEDIELGFRLAPFGLRVVYNRNAVSTNVRAITFDQFCNRSFRQGCAVAAFHRLHPVPEIDRYLGVEEAEQSWPALEGKIKEILARGREVDRIARMKLVAGLPLGSDREILHKAYGESFRASRLRGIVKGLAGS